MKASGEAVRRGSLSQLPNLIVVITQPLDDINNTGTRKTCLGGKRFGACDGAVSQFKPDIEKSIKGARLSVAEQTYAINQPFCLVGLRM